MGKVDVYRDRDLLEITVKWFSPKAYFMLFFTAFWNGFLLVWYTIAFSGGAPLAMKLFPIIHVIVGIFLLYYTICIFFNKTYVDILEDELIVEHKPLPWLGKKSIATRDIEQLYVKESISHSQNGQAQKKYILRAKLFNKSDQKIVDVGSIPIEKLQEIESQLEDFIGIDDKPVKGEYGLSGNYSKDQQPRKHRTDRLHSPLATYFNSSKGNLLNLDGKGLVIMEITQYDWKDRKSDKRFTVSDLDNNESDLFFHQNGARIEAYKMEDTQSWFDASFAVEAQKVKNELYLNGISFNLTFQNEGMMFTEGSSKSRKLTQWLYESDDKRYLLRIFGEKDNLKYQLGTVISITSFSDVLDLNVNFEKEQIIQKKNQNRL